MGNQLFVVAGFDDLAVLEDDDSVGAADSGQTVRDDDTGSPFEEARESLLD